MKFSLPPIMMIAYAITRPSPILGPFCFRHENTRSQYAHGFFMCQLLSETMASNPAWRRGAFFRFRGDSRHSGFLQVDLRLPGRSTGFSLRIAIRQKKSQWPKWTGPVEPDSNTPGFAPFFIHQGRIRLAEHEGGASRIGLGKKLAVFCTEV